MKTHTRHFASSVLLAASVLLNPGCRPAHDPAQPSRPVPIELHGVGFVEPATEVHRLAFPHGGVIEECRLEPGMVVEEGAVLARQHSAEDLAALQAAESEVALAEAELAELEAGVHPDEVARLKARADAADAGRLIALQGLSRQEALAARDAGVAADLEDARANLQLSDAIHREALSAWKEASHRVRSPTRAVARQRVQVARAHGAALAARLRSRELRAPFRGTVLEVLRRQGEAVAEGSELPVVLLADLSQLRVRAELDETLALAARPGAPVMVGGPNLDGQELQGTVVLVKPIMGPKTVFSRAATEHRDLDTRQILVSLPAGTDLPIGLEVDVRIEASAGR